MIDSYLEVLKQYEGEAISVRRGRGAWICEYPDGLRLLKEYRGTQKRLEFESAVQEELLQMAVCRVDSYVKNREDGLMTAGLDGVKYVLKNWFSERECSLRDRKEILFCIRQIAALHKTLQKILWREEWSLGSTVLPALSEEMARHNREMKRVRNFIRTKRKKTEFELRVMQNFDEYYHQALHAEKGLEPLDHDQAGNRLFLCHGDLDQHHILLLPESQTAAFTGFSQMHLGRQMSDLYRFMRKVMEKHGWDEFLGYAMLEAYNAVLPMTEDDRNYLYFLFLYPEKYWKQLNYYYNANKAWIPEKNVEKLKTLEAQQGSRNRFLQNVFQDPDFSG